MVLEQLFDLKGELLNTPKNHEKLSWILTLGGLPKLLCSKMFPLLLVAAVVMARPLSRNPQVTGASLQKVGHHSEYWCLK